MASKPVFEIRRGLIKVRVWRKNSRSNPRYTVTAIRLFRNGEWKESTRYGGDDIPLVRLLLDEAHTWILQHPLRTKP